MKTPVQQTVTVRETMIRLGKNIAEARRAKGWTQQDLANKAGFDSNSLSRIETGSTTPSFPRLIVIADTLDVSLSALLSGTTGKVNDLGDEFIDCLKRLREPDRQFLMQLVRQITDKLAKK